MLLSSTLSQTAFTISQVLIADQRLLCSREVHRSSDRMHEDRGTPARSHPDGTCVRVQGHRFYSFRRFRSVRHLASEIMYSLTSFELTVNKLKEYIAVLLSKWMHTSFKTFFSIIIYPSLWICFIINKKCYCLNIFLIKVNVGPLVSAIKTDTPICKYIYISYTYMYVLLHTFITLDEM